MGILTKRAKEKEKKRGEVKRERERRVGYCVSLQDLETKKKKTLAPLPCLSTQGRDLEAEGDSYAGFQGALFEVMFFLRCLMSSRAFSLCS